MIAAKEGTLLSERPNNVRRVGDTKGSRLAIEISPPTGRQAERMQGGMHLVLELLARRHRRECGRKASGASRIPLDRGPRIGPHVPVNRALTEKG